MRQGGREASSDVLRLRQELASVRASLEEEIAYYKAELETVRQRAEAEQLRTQASEVARRRRAEEYAAEVKQELRLTQQELERLRRRYDEVGEQLLREEERAKRAIQQEVDKYRSAAKTAWESAEQELAEMDGQLKAARRALSEERRRREQLEETVRDVQGLAQDRSEAGDIELKRELSAMKKALQASERGRLQAERRLTQLTDKLLRDEERTVVEDDSPSPPQNQREAANVRAVYQAFRGTEDDAPETDLSHANQILENVLDVEAFSKIRVGDGALHEDFADEFVLVGSDESMGARPAAKPSPTRESSAPPETKAVEDSARASESHEKEEDARDIPLTDEERQQLRAHLSRIEAEERAYAMRGRLKKVAVGVAVALVAGAAVWVYQSGLWMQMLA